MDTAPRVNIHLYHVDGRHPSRGHVLLILTDHPADPAAAAIAATRALNAGVLLFTAVALPHTGFSIRTLLHRARAHRFDTDAAAITARITPTLHHLGVGHFTNTATLSLPPKVNEARRIARHIDAAQIITAIPLQGPPHGLTPTTWGASENT